MLLVLGKRGMKNWKKYINLSPRYKNNIQLFLSLGVKFKKIKG